MAWPATVVDDAPQNRNLLKPGTLVIVADIYGHHIGEAVPGVDYVVHNFNMDTPLMQTVQPENLLRLQVWTNDSTGAQWSDFRKYDHEGRVLYQPWGTDLFSEEFLEPVFNAYSNEVTFVGAVWSEPHEGGDLGNLAMIEMLKLLCADSGLRLRLLTQISDAENIAAVRSARLAPSFAGGWQVEHNYLPCRVFKNISYGALGFTNVPALMHFLDLPDLDMQEMFEWALKLKRGKYLDLVRRQQRKICRYSYRESLVAIERALELGKI